MERDGFELGGRRGGGVKRTERRRERERESREKERRKKGLGKHAVKR